MIGDSIDVREVELNVRITLIHGGQQGGRGICERIEHLIANAIRNDGYTIKEDENLARAVFCRVEVERMEWKQVQRVEDGDRVPGAGRI